jgi:hypothetical protein
MHAYRTCATVSPQGPLSSGATMACLPTTRSHRAVRTRSSVSAQLCGPGTIGRCRTHIGREMNEHLPAFGQQSLGGSDRRDTSVQDQDSLNEKFRLRISQLTGR